MYSELIGAEGESNEFCPDCGEETVDGESKEICLYSPVLCETCGNAPCDAIC